MTATVLETIEHLDFDSALSCEWEESEQCDQEARWHILTKCCAASAVLCDDHHKILVALVIEAINMTRVSLRCAHCRKPFHATAVVEDMFIITPLT